MNDRMASNNKMLEIVNDPTISATDAVKMIRQLLSNSSRPTLADMTDEKREACQWMHADLKVADLTPGERPACRWTHANLKGDGSRVLILNHLEGGGRTRVVWLCGCTAPVAWEKITSRPEPTPDSDEKPAATPTTALPDGWLLADHRKHGRVLVTRPEPDDDGEVAITVSAPTDIARAHIEWCKPDELTYLAQEVEEATPVEVGDIIESADDPRFEALPVGSVLEDRVYGSFHDVTKTATGEWVGLGYKPHAGMGTRWGPWTVRRIGPVADQ